MDRRREWHRHLPILRNRFRHRRECGVPVDEGVPRRHATVLVLIAGRSTAKRIVEHRIANRVNDVTVPVWDIVASVAFLVFLELLQGEFGEGQRAPLGVNYNRLPPRQLLVRESPHLGAQVRDHGRNPFDRHFAPSMRAWREIESCAAELHKEMPEQLVINYHE